MRDTIHLVCSIDDRFVQHCTVMLASIFENNKDEAFGVHIVADRLPDRKTETLRSFISSYGNKAYFYFNHGKLLEQCPMAPNDRLSLATYYRCFLDTILPENIGRVIYMDSDMIVTGPVRELWETDMGGAAAGCVEDAWSSEAEYYERLQYDSGYSYFNAGLILADLALWREYKISDKALNYLAEHRDRIVYHDQDILNALLHDKKIFLSFRWNMQHRFFYTKNRIRNKRIVRPEAWEELEKALADPRVIHFTGRRKPWQYYCEHPYRRLYLKYIKYTPWQDYRPPFTLKEAAIRLLNGAAYAMGLKSRKYAKVGKRAGLSGDLTA